jgi:predicted transcriptional regulator
MEFPEYAPQWKDSGDEENNDEYGYFFEDGFENREHPDAIIYKEADIRWRHVVVAGKALKEKHFHSGPFTEEQFQEELIAAVTQEAIDGLIKKGFIKDNQDGTYSLTELGKSISKQ